MNLSGNQLRKDMLKLNYNAKIFLLINGLFTVANGLSGTFVNIYLWKSKNDLGNIGLFNFFNYLFIPIAFMVGGWLTKRKSATFSLRVGILFHGFFYFLILATGHNSANYVIQLGCVLGIAAGFYWVAFHTLSFDLTSRYNRDTFNSYNGMAGSISGMIAPIIAGYTITSLQNTSGYRIIFGLSTAVYVVIMFIGLMFKTKKEENVFSLLDVYKKSTEPWKYIMLAQLLFGIRQGVLAFLINLVVFITTKKEISIGKLALLGSFIAIPTFIVLEKVLKPRYRMCFFTGGALMMFLSIIVLALKTNIQTLTIYTVLNTIALPLFTVPLNSAAFNVIEKNQHNTYRVEYIILQEIGLNAGRLLGTLIFIMLADMLEKPKITLAFLLFIGSVQLWTLLFRKKIDFDEKVMDEA